MEARSSLDIMTEEMAAQGMSFELKRKVTLKFICSRILMII
jgi:hypothetical protein